ncbi:hypothetical protein EJB05_49153, partial [Eragrostis curvula]
MSTPSPPLHALDMCHGSLLLVLHGQRRPPSSPPLPGGSLLRSALVRPLSLPLRDDDLLLRQMAVCNCIIRTTVLGRKLAASAGRMFVPPSAIMEESNPAAAAGGHDAVALPLDVVFDILVRLPAKEICRLRAVCRPWSSLTSDPVFVEAHAARHPPSTPLIVASFHGAGDHVHVMDLLSGRVLKRVPVANGQTLVRSFSRLDLVCVADRNGSCCSVLNPATGDVSRLPETPPEEHYPPAAPEGHSWIRGPVRSEFTIGRVESTGEYKVLRLSCQDFKHDDDDDDVKHQISSSVLTLNKASAGQSGWRSTGRPNFLVDMDKCAVVGGAAYLLKILMNIRGNSYSPTLPYRTV